VSTLITSHEQQRQNHENQREQNKEASEARIRELQENHTRRIREVQGEADRRVSEIETQLNTQLADARARYEVQLRNLKNGRRSNQEASQARIRQLNENYTRRIREIRAAANRRVAAANRRAVTANQRVEEETAAARKELKKSTYSRLQVATTTLAVVALAATAGKHFMADAVVQQLAELAIDKQESVMVAERMAYEGLGYVTKLFTAAPPTMLTNTAKLAIKSGVASGMAPLTSALQKAEIGAGTASAVTWIYDVVSSRRRRNRN
jgi:hypothetical protein